MTLTEYVSQRVSRLIDSVEEQTRKAEVDTCEAGVHDFRVAVRRLSANLKVFEDAFPSGAAATVRKNLQVAMRIAGETRNHDIARKLLGKAQLSIPPDLAGTRAHAAGKLTTALHNWIEGNTFAAWKGQLHV